MGAEVAPRPQREVMSVGTADIRDSLLPPDDGGMARAFQELDAKLHAWTEAVGALHKCFSTREIELTARHAASSDKALVDAAKPEHESPRTAIDETKTVAPGHAKRSSEDKRSAVEQTNATAASEKPAAQDFAEPVVETARAEQSPRAEKSSEPRVETRQEAEALLADLAPDRAEAIRARHAYFKGRKTIRELIQEFEDEADDEESLLMSLDPEIAKAVRVKYRLYNGRKTLREVIAEVEATPQQPQQTEKKSWWRK